MDYQHELFLPCGLIQNHVFAFLDATTCVRIMRTCKLFYDFMSRNDAYWVSQLAKCAVSVYREWFLREANSTSQYIAITPIVKQPIGDLAYKKYSMYWKWMYVKHYQLLGVSVVTQAPVDSVYWSGLSYSDCVVQVS